MASVALIDLCAVLSEVVQSGVITKDWKAQALIAGPLLFVLALMCLGCVCQLKGPRKAQVFMGVLLFTGMSVVVGAWIIFQTYIHKVAWEPALNFLVTGISAGLLISTASIQIYNLGRGLNVKQAHIQLPSHSGSGTKGRGARPFTMSNLSDFFTRPTPASLTLSQLTLEDAEYYSADEDDGEEFDGEEGTYLCASARSSRASPIVSPRGIA